MRNLAHAAAIIGLAIGFGAANADTASAPGLVGAWVITSEGRRGPSDSVLTVATAEDGSYSGTWVGQRGRELEVRNILVEGDSFSFEMTVKLPVMSVDLTYRGTLAGDAMSGTIETPRGEQPFTGVRREAAEAGGEAATEG